MKTHLLIVLLLCLYSCQPKSEDKVINPNRTNKIEISNSVFGSANDEQVQLYTLKNKNGMEVKITNYGGIITSIIVPDKNGKLDDVALGFNDLDSYLGKHPYFGAIIGRYGNRIADAKFYLDQKEYNLAANNGKNNLHGGTKGFDKHIWEAKKTHSGIRLTRVSPDMEEGFPGTLSITVDYELSHDNTIIISYEAVTDMPTICNLTNHTYFNLAGEGSGSILDHALLINANNYNPVNPSLIPTGISSVKNTPFDFTMMKKIGDDINDDHPQIKNGGGYDHNWVLSDNDDNQKLAATVIEHTTGRKMDVFTSEPGVQFYTGNFLKDIVGKSGKTYNERSGFCLETQHFPDSPNQPDFPSTILKPGDKYISQTSYKFSIVK